jgi:hypothetical protein
MLRAMIWIGDRSYSIYLFHMPLLYIPVTSPVFADSQFPRFVGILISIIATLLISNLVYTKVEEYFRVYRGSNSRERNNFGMSSLKILGILVFPVAIFFLLIQGEENRYWGLDQNLAVPSYAGFIDPNCLRDSRDGPPCIYGDNPKANTVLLVGDSHAGHYSQVIVDAAEEAGWNSIIWTHSACRFELYKDVPNWCKSVNFRILQFIRTTSPEIVILSQSNGTDPDIKSSIKSISLLMKTSNKLVVVDETPQFTDSRFMNSGSLFQLPYNPPKFRKMNMQSEEYVVNANKIYANKKLNEINILNLNHNYCDLDSCRRWKAGEWLFRDLNHLSVEGANLAFDDFSKLLRNFTSIK